MAVALSMSLALPAQAAVPGDFAGPWVSTDAVEEQPGDGDRAQSEDHPRRTLADGVRAHAPAILRGRGEISGDDLDAPFRVSCLGGASLGAAFTFHLTAPEQLTDGTGTNWFRLVP